MVKAAVEGINNGVWVKQAYTFSVYLCAQDNLIIAMNVKCPKKMNRWAHLGRLLNFYKSYRHPLLEHTKDKRPNLMPSDQWWIITYPVAPTIDAISVMLAQLQVRSLLIGQQETIMQNLLSTIIAMFEIEIGDVDNGEARKDDT
jgi:hypothetical protein